MEYAMFIVFLLFLDIHTAHCQTTTIKTPVNFISSCSFSNNIYTSNAAVFNQFTFLNTTSIVLTAYYAFPPSSSTVSTFDLGLIYPFPTSNYLVPFPILLNCSSIVQSCLLKTMAGSTSTLRDGEAINVRLTPFNYTSTSILFNQRGFYLREGQYQLSNCILNTDGTITDNQTIFSIQIQYEKSVGTPCSSSSNTCGSSSLTNCSSSSSTCTCLSTSPLVSYSNSSYCADTLNTSGCTIFPTRCITWCNSTTNTLCICPTDTLKISRNNLYVCELSVDAVNCSSNDSIRRCSFGQSCINSQCVNDLVTTTTITGTTKQSNDSTDQRLRIALGVIAGLLGTSVLVLLGVFCWLRQRQKRARRNAEESLSPSSSATSSLYISPIQPQDQHQRKLPSIYQLSTGNHYNNQRFSPVYRTDSFRRAVHSGHQRFNHLTEHVSAKRDSLSSPKDDFGFPPYGTLEFIVPNHQNIYQTIIPPSTPSILTHSV